MAFILDDEYASLYLFIIREKFFTPVRVYVEGFRTYDNWENTEERLFRKDGDITPRIKTVRDTRKSLQSLPLCGNHGWEVGEHTRTIPCGLLDNRTVREYPLAHYTDPCINRIIIMILIIIKIIIIIISARIYIAIFWRRFDWSLKGINSRQTDRQTDRQTGGNLLRYVERRTVKAQKYKKRLGRFSGDKEELVKTVYSRFLLFFIN